MHLLKELIVNILGKEDCKVEFNITNDAFVQLVDSTCFLMLKQIKQIVLDKNLDDFGVVEKIIAVFEQYDIDVGTRHDFG